MLRLLPESMDMLKRGVIAVSSVAGALTAAGLLSDIKTRPWRGNGTAETITISWAAPVVISCAVAPWCNLSSLATMRVRGYTLPDDAAPAVDTGAQIACPGGGANTQWGLGANSYAFGGYATAVAWFAPTSVRRLVIDVSDSGNPSGYIEVSRLLAGAYWQPTYNARYGTPTTLVDTGTNARNEAGDLVGMVGFRYKKLSLNLGWLTPTDRAYLVDALAISGKTSSHFLSLFPRDADGKLEGDYQIYGRVTGDSAFSIESFEQYATTLEIESV